MNAIELKNEIIKAFSAAEADHDHAQVCLWFADGSEEIEDGAYYGEYDEIAPVVSASVDTHKSGGGVARGGDHIDFCVDRSEWLVATERQRLAECKRILDAACEWSYNHLAAPSFDGFDFAE